MDVFIQQNLRLIASTLYLAFAIVAFGYAIPYQNRDVSTADLGVVNAELKRENDLLSKRIKATRTARRKSTSEVALGVKQMPSFMRRINRIANQNDVIIRRLTPTVENRFTYRIDIITDYRTFLRFTSQLESLDTVVDDLEVHPYGMNPKSNKLEHTISFSITPRNDAEPISGERLKNIQTDVEVPDIRNPFIKKAEGPQGGLDEIDLTWINKLTGIGQDNDGAVATIDKLTYRVGDTLANTQQTITHIQSDRILLEIVDEDGTQRFLLKFRD